MGAGIPVLNLDRIFNSLQASRCWIGGDNYGMGFNAGTTSASGSRTSRTRVVELAGMDSLELPQQRTQGFDDALKNYPNSKKVVRQASEFTVESGQSKMAFLLQVNK